MTGEEESEGRINMVLNWFRNRGSLGKFLLILAFASVPNPLFDLAGIISGYLLLPFFSFFIPTLIGKAVIKVSIQCAFIILVFNKQTLEASLKFIENHVPFLKGTLQSKFDNIKSQFHRHPGGAVEIPEKALLARIWDFVLFIMISYFIISIIHSKVQEYLINEQLSKLDKNKKN